MSQDNMCCRPTGVERLFGGDLGNKATLSNILMVIIYTDP